METQQRKKAQYVRRRGRPAGQNRVPLSLEERRARNAQYEKERRIEQSEAMSQLAEAVGCVPNISNSELLATVVNYLQRSADMSPVEDIDALRRCNGNILRQIASLEQRLAEGDTDSPNMAAASSASATWGSGENRAIRIRTHANKRGRKKVKLTPETHAWSHPSPPTSEFKAETDALHSMKNEELVFTDLESSQFLGDPVMPEEDSDRVHDFTNDWSVEDFIVQCLR